jgi:uncharacterized protein
MKATPVIIVVAIICVIGIFIYSASGSNDADYKLKVQADREEKNDFMKSGKGSPFENSEEPFTELKYFDPNLKYRIDADLEMIEDRNVVVLQTSDNQEQRYIDYAWASFTLDGVKCKLKILEVMDSGPKRGALFLAFADQSSAMETYGAGRYLDIKKVPGAKSVTLDFNEAYNPYCAYSETFSCPFPPRENVLNVLIAAGEKNYH